MIINNKKFRISFLYLLLLIVVGIFVFRLAQLQIVQGDQYADLAQNKMVQKIINPAPRGEILSADGERLAKNRIGYSVELIYANMEDGKRNTVLLELYQLLEENEEEFADDFPIVIENNAFAFTFDREEREWKKENEIPQEATAAEAIALLRDRYNVKEEVNNQVAIEAIENVHLDSTLPIRITEGDAVYTFRTNERSWKESYGFQEEELDFSPEQSFEKIRESFQIDESYSDEEARNIMVFRQLIKDQGFRSWEPVEIVEDIDLKTVLEIDSRIHTLPGISVKAKPIREYPYGSMASHILGYMGKVGEADVEEGYQMNSVKGISGIESAFEEYLKGQDGESLTVTDYLGRPQDDEYNEETNEAIPGSDLYLTIDLKLQQAAEKALKEQLDAIQKPGNAPNAESGAAVVMDVNTGAVLAMASYPAYDPNLFATGISTEDWNRLNVTVDDPLYPRPLFNNATLTALQPGSTFKPFMSIAGLEEGAITRSSTIYCGGVHSVFTQFSCLGRHGNETVVDAIRDSCNVFFYETGYRLGVDKLEEYARRFGLGQRTGLEISESRGYLATRTDKKQVWTYSLSDYIRYTIGITGIGTIINDEGEEQQVYQSYAIAKEVFEEVDESYSGYGEVYRKVAEIMEEHNVKETTYLHRITDYVLAGRWVATDTINASIGQGGNSMTPIQLASYISTLVNGGKRYEAHLVDHVVDYQGNTIYKNESNLLEEMDFDQRNVDAIKEGMRQVTTRSTGAYAFRGFDHANIGVGGKTGTAQYGGDRVDNTAWFVSFAPFDEPEIAVVSMIVQGRTSSNAVPVARQIMDAYFGLGDYSQEKEIEADLSEDEETQGIQNNQNELIGE